MFEKASRSRHLLPEKRAAVKKEKKKSSTTYACAANTIFRDLSYFTNRRRMFEVGFVARYQL
jgi:hypothetical protein